MTAQAQVAGAGEWCVGVQPVHRRRGVTIAAGGFGEERRCTFFMYFHNQYHILGVSIFLVNKSSDYKIKFKLNNKIFEILIFFYLP
jgi:hypothetical protein